MRVFQSKGFLPVLLCLIVTAAYSPTFSGEFILDDLPFVKDNAYLRDFHGISSYLSQEDGIKSDAQPGSHSGYYRPLVALSYTLDFKLWGMNPAGFRATNLILHLMTCLLLFKVMTSLTGRGPGPFLAVLLFGLHPANTETVSWIASRNNILVTLFGLASFFFYVKRTREGKEWAGIFSLLNFAIALLCKEFAVMLLPVLVVYDWFMGGKGKGLQERVWGYGAFLAVGLSYMILRSLALHGLVPPPGADHFSRAVYFAPYLILYNLRIILVPFGLHNFIIHYPESRLGMEALAGFVGAGLLACLVWRERKAGIFMFPFSSFLVALFPVLNIIPTSAYSLVAMRWLYFPMSLLFLSAPWFLNELFKTKRAALGGLLLGIGLIYLGTYTFILNRDLWRSEEDFFTNEVVLFGNDLSAGGYARVLYAHGKHSQAERYFQIAERVSPEKPFHAINHAANLLKLGKPEKALVVLGKVEPLPLTGPLRAILLNNRGSAHFMMKEYGAALTSYAKAVLFAPESCTFLLNLGRVYLVIEDYGKAIETFQKCLDLESNDPLVRKMLGLSYLRMGDHEKAREWLLSIPGDTRKSDPEIREALKRAGWTP